MQKSVYTPPRNARRHVSRFPGANVRNTGKPPGDDLHWTAPAHNWNFACAECHDAGDHRVRGRGSLAGHHILARTHDRIAALEGLDIAQRFAQTVKRLKTGQTLGLLA